MTRITALVFLLVSIFVSTPVVYGDHIDLDSLPDCGFEMLPGMSETRIGAVIINFETGTGCAQNLDERFQVASVPKLFVAGAYYDWLAQGLVSPTTRLPFNEQYWMAGTNACLTESELGNVYTTLELAELMISCSDNSATWMLMDSLGWSRIQTYIEELGIEGIGRVIPYSDVDRQKLILHDERWSQVPRGLASRFYRSRMTTGLIPTYFDEAPTLRRPDILAMNAQYVASTTANTATPRAIATYMMKLHHDLTSMDSNAAIVARRIFNAMLQTQRQHSAQAFPGTVLVGAKNGLDTGLTAEVNIIFEDVSRRIPTGIAIVFTQQENFFAPDVQTPNRFDGTLNRYLRAISPDIVAILYPEGETPAELRSGVVSSVVFGQRDALEPCWWPYWRAEFADEMMDALERCWLTLMPQVNYQVGDDLGVGLSLRRLNRGSETLVTFIFTAPDGTRYSSQVSRQFKSDTGIYRYHPVDRTGPWQIDIFVNLELVYSGSVRAGR